MKQPQIYQSKYGRISSSSHATVFKVARAEYHKIQKRTPRRQASVKSKYFLKDKVFIGQYWEDIKPKRISDQVRRTRLYHCAIDLIQNTTLSPETIYRADNPDTALHRFYGHTKDGLKFCVQIRENKRTNRKDFMSVFPIDTSKQ